MVVLIDEQAEGYYTFLPQSNSSSPAGETGPWILYYKHEPTPAACSLVYRTYYWGFRDSVVGPVQ